MDCELTLIDIIKRYQEGADKAVKIFQNKYNVDNILVGWWKGLYEQTGTLKEEGLYFYAFHGIGLAAHFKDMIVDFDFAEFPEPRHDGFDLWRLGNFIRNQRNKYPHFLDKEKLEQEFNSLIKEGIIANPDLKNSTTLYFFTSSLPENITIVNENLNKIHPITISNIPTSKNFSIPKMKELSLLKRFSNFLFKRKQH